MNNPLSPHLQIYKWQITSVLSILHRITGVVSSLGAVILILILFSIGVSEEFFMFNNNILNYFVKKFEKHFKLFSISKVLYS